MNTVKVCDGALVDAVSGREVARFWAMTNTKVGRAQRNALTKIAEGAINNTGTQDVFNNGQFVQCSTDFVLKQKSYR